MEPSAGGVGAKTFSEDVTDEMVCMPAVSRGKAKAKAMDVFTIADRQNIFRENAPTSKKGKSNGK